MSEKKGVIMPGKSGILRLPEVLKLVGLSRTTLWRRIKSGDFPAAILLGPPGSRAKGWLLEEILDWLSKRPRA